MKKFYALFLLCLAMLFYSFSNVTCFAEAQTNKNVFKVQRLADEDGKIVISYIFPLNSDVFHTMNEQNSFTYYLFMYVNSLANHYKKDIEGVTVENCKYFSESDGLGFSITFKNIDAQKEYFGTSEDDSTPNLQKSGFFVQKLTLKTSFAFSRESANSYKTLYENCVNSWAENMNISAETKQTLLKRLENATFEYDYASTSNVLKSKNCYSDGKYYHSTFTKTLSEIEEDDSIEFYASQINYPVWYLLALVLVIFGMICAYFVLKKKKKV